MWESVSPLLPGCRGVVIVLHGSTLLLGLSTPEDVASGGRRQPVRGTWSRSSTYLESQWRMIMGYFVSVMGYFRVYGPVLFAYLALQVGIELWSWTPKRGLSWARDLSIFFSHLFRRFSSMALWDPRVSGFRASGGWGALGLGSQGWGCSPTFCLASHSCSRM